MVKLRAAIIDADGRPLVEARSLFVTLPPS
jgi:hypothetical protein